ncbi:MAG: ribonuclease J [Acidobacteriota bacterium]|nr:ribonuclease J [Acidobacteriota bacterium]
MSETTGGRTRVIPLGGVGEFGANATVIQTEQTTILVDFGLMFPPDNRHPGVDYYVIDMELFAQNFPQLDAVFLTHGHEDHIGGLSFLMARYPVPLFALPYTTGIVRKSLDYDNIKADYRKCALNDPITVGDISVEFVGVTHSIVQAAALFIQTPDASLVHTGDFKVDPLPEDNHPFQSARFKELGEQGVDLLIMDSTNATKDGFCPSDFEIVPNLEDLILNAKGRVFLTTFSSHMPRIKRLKHIARNSGRKIAFVGRSFHKHFQMSLETAYMAYWPGVFTTVEEAVKLPDEQIIYVVTGSQAEQRSALMRIQRTGFKSVSFKAGDLVIFSSKTIPGNERRIMLLGSDLQRDGVRVIMEKGTSVHTSGHGYREDIAYMLSLVKPRSVAPIHGEFHQLLSHHNWLQSLTLDHQQVLLIEDGDIIELSAGEARCIGKIEIGMVPIDGNQNLPLDRRTISERKDMMYSGLVLVSANVRPDEGFYDFQVQTHGLAELHPGAAAKALEGSLQSLVLDAEQDEYLWAEDIGRCLKKGLKSFFAGKPMTKLVLNGRILI